MPTFWQLLNEPSRKAIRRFMGKRWRDPDAKPDMDEMPVDVAREMQKRPRGSSALLGGGHGL